MRAFIAIIAYVVETCVNAKRRITTFLYTGYVTSRHFSESVCLRICIFDPLATYETLCRPSLTPPPPSHFDSHTILSRRGRLEHYFKRDTMTLSQSQRSYRIPRQARAHTYKAMCASVRARLPCCACTLKWYQTCTVSVVHGYYLAIYQQLFIFKNFFDQHFLLILIWIVYVRIKLVKQLKYETLLSYKCLVLEKIGSFLFYQVSRYIFSFSFSLRNSICKYDYFKSFILSKRSF